MSLSDAIKFIIGQSIDLMIPHMYCIPGMTHYRALFDLIKIPYIGNTPEVMGIAAHKARSKAIVAAAGVKVPLGEVLRQGETSNIVPPAVVKPVDADNSLGMSLVKTLTEYDAALQKAFEHSDEVIVEKFIEPGREIRCSIIVKEGELIALPLEEYQVDLHKRPVRTYEDKFPELDAHGNFIGWPPSDPRVRWFNEDSDDPTTKKIHEAAKKCHIAMGCRHYSMFDFRIDPHGEPWFIEAGLYCSFGGGGIRKMAELRGISLDELLTIMIKEAMTTRQ